MGWRWRTRRPFFTALQRAMRASASVQSLPGYLAVGGWFWSPQIVGSPASGTAAGNARAQDKCSHTRAPARISTSRSAAAARNAGVWAAKIWMFPFDPTCSSLGLAHYHANASPPARRKTQRIIPSCSFCAAWPPPAPRPPRRQSEAGRGEAPGRVWGVERRRLRPAAPRATRPPCAAPLH